LTLCERLLQRRYIIHGQSLSKFSEKEVYRFKIDEEETPDNLFFEK
jgi:hypothetical protein